MEHIIRMSCLFCFLLHLLDTFSRSYDLISHQSYPFILIDLECFCKFSRISFNGFFLHIVIVSICLSYQKHILPTSTVHACSGTHSLRHEASACRRQWCGGAEAAVRVPTQLSAR